MNSHFCRVGTIKPNLNKTLKNKELKEARLNTFKNTDYNPNTTKIRNKH